MLTSRIYYTVKPFLPWRVRIALRRLSARRQLDAHAATWPIDAASARRPTGWTGWPRAKQFAIVLTHDVEGRRGLENCRRVMELERRFGLRSSFNFIPEGEYRVSPAVRATVTDAGFEVGVHDLNHDGKLFQSQKGFERRAPQINRYIREWNAAGFRSGFMLRNLDWLHALDIQYDSSTFDTDPFEPQPEGIRSIFPLWIAGVQPGAGYVELPYTMPQDSTLYLVLQQPGPATWLKKLEWIVQQGGMALVNIHPDYLDFGERGPHGRSYPVAHYIQFLEHLTSRYSDIYWNALPREAAAHARSMLHPAADPRRSRPTAGHASAAYPSFDCARTAH